MCEKKQIKSENQSNEEFNMEKYHLETGKQFNDLIAHYPITVEELLKMSQVLCEFVGRTRIIDISEYFFLDGSRTIPRLRFILDSYLIQSNVRGKWEKSDAADEEFNCSICGESALYYNNGNVTKSCFCPSCGAKMDGNGG